MKYTQCGQILGYMRGHATINPMQALKKFGCMRLAARINDLKNEGFEIYREIVVNPKTKKRYAEYSLRYRFSRRWGIIKTRKVNKKS